MIIRSLIPTTLGCFLLLALLFNACSSKPESSTDMAQLAVTVVRPVLLL